MLLFSQTSSRANPQQNGGHAHCALLEFLFDSSVSFFPSLPTPASAAVAQTRKSDGAFLLVLFYMEEHLAFFKRPVETFWAIFHVPSPGSSHCPRLDQHLLIPPSSQATVGQCRQQDGLPHASVFFLERGFLVSKKRPE